MFTWTIRFKTDHDFFKFFVYFRCIFLNLHNLKTTIRKFFLRRSGATTLNIMTITIMTLSIKDILVTFSIMTLRITTLCNFDECRCAQCHVLFLVIQNVIILSVVMLGVVMLNVVMLSVVTPSNFPSGCYVEYFFPLAAFKPIFIEKVLLQEFRTKKYFYSKNFLWTS
jgi:hypothetical protein